MLKICTLKKLFPAMKYATENETSVLRDGIQVVSESPNSMPLMDIEYALSDQACDIVNKYADVA